MTTLRAVPEPVARDQTAVPARATVPRAGTLSSAVGFVDRAGVRKWRTFQQVRPMEKNCSPFPSSGEATSLAAPPQRARAAATTASFSTGLRLQVL
eukprot:1187884-Prorocentrum_minimum.AAC.3